MYGIRTYKSRWLSRPYKHFVLAARKNGSKGFVVVASAIGGTRSPGVVGGSRAASLIGISQATASVALLAIVLGETTASFTPPDRPDRIDYTLNERPFV